VNQWDFVSSGWIVNIMPLDQTLDALLWPEAPEHWERGLQQRCMLGLPTIDITTAPGPAFKAIPVPRP